MSQSLQETHAAGNACFGCGPANPKGLRIRSFPEGDQVVCTWQGEAHHEAWPGALNGGIVGALLDCHCNWTAAWHLMSRAGAPAPPFTVTAEYAVKLVRPAPSTRPVRLTARVVESTERRAVVEGELSADEEICATLRGTFVAVKEGHPAFRRW